MSNRGSITLSELQGKLDLLEIKCHRCERHGRVTLARLIEEHGADTGLPDLWESLAGDCPNARTAALNSRWPSTIRNCRRCSCRAINSEAAPLRNLDGPGLWPQQ